jgi:flagellar biosynthetic protein FliR
MLDFFTWLLVFFRAGAFLVIFPLFSAPNVPVRLRIVLAAFLSMMVAPGLGNPVDPASLNLVKLGILVFKEVTLGFFLGFICRIFFSAIQLAGHFISTDIGLQTSTILTPDGVPVDVPAAVLNLLTTMLFLSLDVHHILISAFQQTYLVLPIGNAGLSDALFHDLTLRTGKTFLLAVQIAAPIMAISFMVGVVLMMLGRAVPQMNIFFESFTIRLFIGLIVFGFSIQLMAQRISDNLRRIPQDLAEVTRLLREK